jgi:D-alanine transaminase
VSWTYLNKSFVKKEEVKISPFDRGFLFGDSVYELIPSYGKKLFLYDEHLLRLSNSLKASGIRRPSVWNNLREIISELIIKNEFENQSIYIQISRGEELLRDHVPCASTLPTLFISSTKLSPSLHSDLQNLNSDFKVKTHTDFRWSRCDIKANTLLGNVMSLNDADIDEVVFHKKGLITEGARSNIFLVFGDEVVTPPVSNNMLSGITRQYFLDKLQENTIRVTEREVEIRELDFVDEVWFSNSSKLLKFVTHVNKRALQKSFSGSICEEAIGFFILDILS